MLVPSSDADSLDRLLPWYSRVKLVIHETRMRAWKDVLSVSAIAGMALLVAWSYRWCIEMVSSFVSDFASVATIRADVIRPRCDEDAQIHV